MAVDYTTTALLAAIKRKLQIPSGSTKLSDTELLAIADEEMRSYVYPRLLRTGQNYGIEQCTIPLVGNQQRYLLPPPCNADTIVNVALVDTNSSLREMHSVPVLRIDAWGTTTSTIPREYSLQSSYIHVLPTPVDATCSIRIRFERVPGRLVATTAEVQADTVVDGTFSLSGTPSGWTTGQTYVTAYRSGPPFNCPFGYSLVTATEDSTVWDLGTPLWGELDDTYTTSAMYPDYICQWNQSPVVPLPEAWHPVMLYAASSAVAREYGDDTEADYLRAEADARVERMIQSANSRVRKDAQIAFDRWSPLRQGMSRLWRQNP